MTYALRASGYMRRAVNGFAAVVNAALPNALQWSDAAAPLWSDGTGWAE